MATKPKTTAPYMPVSWDNFDAQCIKALVRGDADPEQQKHAIDFIINKVARTYDLSYRPDPLETAFAEGGRFVGLQLVKLINIDLSSLIKE